MVGMLTAACSSSAGRTPSAPPGLTAALGVASATLAGDCGEGKVAAARDAPITAPAARAAIAPASCPVGVDCSFHAPCQQSSVQLTLRAVGSGAPAPVVVTAVELLDPAGAVLGTMDPRVVTRWTDGRYGAWDGQLHAGEDLRLSLPTGEPPWGKVPGGRFGNGTFQVRVTVTVGGQAITAASTASVAPEPVVVT